MRIVLASLAAVVCSACSGMPSEALTHTGPRTALEESHDRLVLDRQIEDRGARNVDPVASEPVPQADEERAQALREIATTIGYAADLSYSGAAAGTARNVAGAQQAAVAAFDTAQAVERRALALMGVAEGGEIGCGGNSEPIDDAVLADAVNTAFRVALATSEIVGALQPEDRVECSFNDCHEECRNVPGEVDQGQLDAAILAAVTAGDACGALEESLAR